MKSIIVFLYLLQCSPNSEAQFVNNFDYTFNAKLFEQFGYLYKCNTNYPYHSFQICSLDEGTCITNENIEIELTINSPNHVPINPKNLPGYAMDFVNIYSEETDQKCAYYYTSQSGVKYIEVQVKNFEILFDEKGMSVISVRKVE